MASTTAAPGMAGAHPEQNPNKVAELGVTDQTKEFVNAMIKENNAISNLQVQDFVKVNAMMLREEFTKHLNETQASILTSMHVR